MSSSVYAVNKRINKPLEFKGLKGPFLYVMGGGLVFLLVLFAILKAIGIGLWTLFFIIVFLGGGTVMFIYKLNNKYGVHGISKTLAKAQQPRWIRIRSRKVFLDLKKNK
jgi:hypothetical protein